MITRIIDVNDTKHRYYLCRELTHQEMGPQFQVKFSVVGKYYPNRSLATEGAPPLQLHIHGEEEGVQKAAAWVQKIIEKGPPKAPLPATQSTGEKMILPFQFEETHVFALRNAIQGPQGENLKFISSQTGASISLRGRGSGSIMTADDQKQPFHLIINAPTEMAGKAAREMLNDLMHVVEFEYSTSKQLGYFTSLGGMFAPDQVLIQAANNNHNQNINNNPQGIQNYSSQINNTQQNHSMQINNTQQNHSMQINNNQGIDNPQCQMNPQVIGTMPLYYPASQPAIGISFNYLQKNKNDKK